jgi:hypothetical protein
MAPALKRIFLDDPYAAVLSSCSETIQRGEVILSRGATIKCFCGMCLSRWPDSHFVDVLVRYCFSHKSALQWASLSVFGQKRTSTTA